MKRFVKYIYLVVIFMLLIFNGCTEKVDIDLDNSTVRLVVYGEISNVRKEHEVRLSRTTDYFNSEDSEKVSGAIITISAGLSSVSLEEVQPGLYRTPMMAGVPERTYRLQIENIDINNDGTPEYYEAESYLPPVAPIDSIKLSYMTNIFISGWQILLYALDPFDRKDFYAYKVHRNQILQTDSLSEYIFRSDAFFNGQSTNGMVSQFLYDNEPQEKVKRGDLITLEVNGITEDYFNFLSETQIEISPKIPLFSGPPANVKSNISNNAVGFFTAYSSTRASIIVPQKE